MIDEARFNPLKVVRWTREIKGALDGVVTAAPIRANVDLTNLCNHSCDYCEPAQFREQSINDRKHTLDYSTALEVIRDLANMHCRMIHFSGGGEPLLHPRFGDLLANAKQLGMRTFVVTNGTYIRKWQAELRNCADHIRISLDASTAKQHIAIHKGHANDFVEITSAIRDLCAGAERPEVGIGYVLTSQNCSRHSILGALELCRGIGLDFIQFRPVSDGTLAWGDEWHDWEELSAWIRKFGSLAGEPKVIVSGSRDSDAFGQREFSQCYAALTVAVISATGEVAACCDRRDIVFGNVYHERLREIWQSGTHRAKSQAIEPKLCTRCLMCGFNRAVEKYVVNNGALVEFV